MSIKQRKLNQVPFTQVTFHDAFWTPRMEVNRKASLPHIFRKLEETGRISAFDLNFDRTVPSPVYSSSATRIRPSGSGSQLFAGHPPRPGAGSKGRLRSG